MLLALEILGNMCIAFAYFLYCGVINFELDVIFLTKRFSYMTKKLRQKYEDLENKKSF